MLTKSRCPAAGFTLIEMALVLLVITLLLGGLLVPLSTQLDQRNVTLTQKQLDEIKEALVGYALQNRYLPCPDTDGDGGQNRSVPPATQGTCLAYEGALPWADLGVGETDAWGNRFLYRVTPAFSDRAPVAAPPPPPFTLGSAGTIEVCTASGVGSCADAGTSLANDAVLVVLSVGKNRGLCGNPPLANNCVSDERENLDIDNRFIMRTIGGQGSGGGEFDDLVVWLSPFKLFDRMVAAGLLTTAPPPP